MNTPEHETAAWLREDLGLSARAAGLLLFVPWAVVFGTLLVGDGTLYERDALLLFLPLRSYLQERLLSGELPLWYPYESLGAPFAGQLVSGLFHPLTWLLLPFAPATALTLHVALLFLLGMWGAYRLCRQVAFSRGAAVGGAWAFAFGGYGIGMAYNLPYLSGLMTLPWVAYFAHRVWTRQRGRDAALLALAWALVFLAGDAQSALFAPLLFLPLLAVGAPSVRRVGLVALAGGLSLLLVGVELFPAMVAGAESVRAQAAFDPDFLLLRSFSPLRLPGLWVSELVPVGAHIEMSEQLFRGGYGLWTRTVFAGGVTLLLALAAVAGRRRVALAWAGVGALGLLLSMADHGLLLPLLWKVAPGLAKLRFAEKYLAFFWVALAPLAAVGVEAMALRPGRWAAVAGGAAAAVVASAFAVRGLDLAGLVWQSAGHTLSPFDPLRELVEGTWKLGLLRTGGMIAALAGLLVAMRAQPRVALLIPAVVFVELWSGIGDHLTLVDRAVLETPHPYAERIRAAASGAEPPARVRQDMDLQMPGPVSAEGNLLWAHCARQAMLADTGGLEGISAMGELLPATSNRHFMLLGHRAEKADRWGGDFNVCWRVARWGAALAPGEHKVSENEECRTQLIRVPCRPRAYLAAATSAPGGGARSAMQAMDGLPPATVVWEGGPELPGGRGAVRWVQNRPEHQILEVETDAPSALVVADQFAPGWTATVDGTPATIHPTQVAVRGIALQPGKHTVELRYRVPRLPAGAAMSGLGLLAVGGLLWRERRRR